MSVRIRPGLLIPEGELTFTAARGGGPGGQHVNKVSTRVTLWFDVEGSPSLTEAERARIRARLATRIGRDGRLRVVCGIHRSQAANRDEATLRFAALLREALARRKPRRETAVPRAEKRRRVEAKRRRSDVKRGRGRVRDGGEDR